MRLHSTILLALVLCLTSGCSGMLPVAKTKDESRWDNFEQAKASFDLIIPFTTTQTDLRQLGFDPYQTSNIQILNYLAIIKKFMPNTNITMADLPPGLRGCVEAKNACVAYEMNIQNIKSQRQGNLFLDLLRFKRQAHQTGWRFSAFIVLVDDLVVYKLWDGQPRIEGEIYRKNPLGPFQEPADIATDAAVISTF
ncbi:MAG: hypothetical protein OEV89_09635 [Desulfobulbaceae bacterium]|nr:hypothetical protein [Desulfobulbaceae bacterium]HIJ90955.1 hypothetical protein [Deltaproteobacteria bacterium]